MADHNLKAATVTSSPNDIDWTDILFGAAGQSASAPEPFLLSALRDKIVVAVGDYVATSGKFIFSNHSNSQYLGARLI